MKVDQLIDLLREADPKATVMLLPADTKEQEAEEVRHAAGVNWTRECGADKGRPYAFLYPGEPHRDVRTDCEEVTYEPVSIVFLAADEEFLRPARTR